jgi:hypothetical protein
MGGLTAGFLLTYPKEAEYLARLTFQLSVELLHRPQ